MMRRTRHLPRAAPLPLLLLLSAAALPACDLAVIAAAPFEDRGVDALAELPPGRVLVWFENPGGVALGDTLARQAGVAAAHYLVAEGERARADLIPLEQADRLRVDIGEAAFDRLPLDALGRRVGADVVVAGTVRQLDLDPRTSASRPAARLDVRVIEAATGRRVFPDGGAGSDEASGSALRSRGHPVTASLALQLTGDADPRTLQRRTRELADALGRSAARLFYGWERPSAGEAFLDEHERVRRGEL